MMRARNFSWRYSHSVDTFASAATLRKLMSRSEASIRCNAAKARSIACSLRRRALCLRPIVFLRMCSLQGRDDVHEVISFAFIHFDLPCPTVCGCLGDHSLGLPKLCLMRLKKADIGAEV